MVVASLITASILLVLITVMIRRALAYLHEHPELLTAEAPLAYQRCHTTLAEVITRYKVIQDEAPAYRRITWQSPYGRVYRIDEDGVEEQREVGSERSVRHLRWPQIGGVGLRMQPAVKRIDESRTTDVQITAGYSFQLLIVPRSGDTLEILIPTNGRDDAVDFVARTVALAEQLGKRVNTFGFDRPPAPPRQRVSKL
jgi:hypothetical protein